MPIKTAREEAYEKNFIIEIKKICESIVAVLQKDLPFSYREEIKEYRKNTGVEGTTIIFYGSTDFRFDLFRSLFPPENPKIKWRVYLNCYKGRTG